MVRDEVRAFILNNGDEKYKKFHIGLTPGIDAGHTAGIKVPVLRDYAKQHDAWVNRYYRLYAPKK